MIPKLLPSMALSIDFERAFLLRLSGRKRTPPSIKVAPPTSPPLLLVEAVSCVRRTDRGFALPHKIHGPLEPPHRLPPPPGCHAGPTSEPSEPRLRSLRSVPRWDHRGCNPPCDPSDRVHFMQFDDKMISARTYRTIGANVMKWQTLFAI